MDKSGFFNGHFDYAQSFKGFDQKYDPKYDNEMNENTPNTKFTDHNSYMNEKGNPESFSTINNHTYNIYNLTANLTPNKGDNILGKKTKKGYKKYGGNGKGNKKYNRSRSKDKGFSSESSSGSSSSSRSSGSSSSYSSSSSDKYKGKYKGNKHRQNKEKSLSQYIAEEEKKVQKEEEEEDKSDNDEIVHYPYKIGEQINGYRVTKFIYDGTFGRVLECMDILSGNIYAMKIIRSVKRYIKTAKIEVDIINAINSKDKYKTGHVIKVIDSFKFINFNKEYYGIVFERSGYSLYEFLKINNYRPYPMTQIQSIARQLIEGISTIHKIGFIHTDLKLENVLFTHSEADKVRAQTKLPINVIADDAKNRDNGDQPKKQLMYYRVKSADIKIIDFGSAVENKTYHSGIINTRQYRAPEVILECGFWNDKSDIWSIGCLLLELYTGELLFETHENQEHLCLIEKVCGHYPRWMVSDSDAKNLSSLFSTCSRHRDKVINLKRVARYDEVKKHLQNQRMFYESIAPKHSMFIKFLKDMLVIDPNKRPSCDDLLKHEFFSTKFED